MIYLFSILRLGKSALSAIVMFFLFIVYMGIYKINKKYNVGFEKTALLNTRVR